MSQPRYTVEYDSYLGLSRWQVVPGERLLAPSLPVVRPTCRVVALGGGTGLPILLRGLKQAFFPPGWTWVPRRDRDRLTAIVTVADDGGSSGRLRQAYQVLPPGDIRNCLLALSDGDPTMAAIFDFRFSGQGEMAGHSLGNLILTALSQLETDFSEAVERGGEILAIRGRVFPSTLENVALRAEFADGSWVQGESRIASVRRPIRRVSLQPEDARALPQAVEAVQAADLIVIGPGSLYTSLMPILLVKELAEAIAHSGARVVLVMNLMTEPGETDGYGVAEHLGALAAHGLPLEALDYVVVNTSPIPPEVRARYAADGAEPVGVDFAPPAGPPLFVFADVLDPGPVVRHAAHKLGSILCELAAGHPEPGEGRA